MPQSLYALKTPDWPHWNERRSLPLWIAVALVCNIDPTALEPFGPAGGHGFDGPLSPAPAEFKERLTLATAAIGSEALPVKVAPGQPLTDGEVDMTHFATWLRNIGLQPPDAFVWRPAELRTDKIQWPWGSHSTGHLVLLARAADRFWKHYDPTDISTAPRNDDVISWLVAQGMAKRMAESVATMLRAEDVRTGPR